MPQWSHKLEGFWGDAAVVAADEAADDATVVTAEFPTAFAADDADKFADDSADVPGASLPEVFADESDVSVCPWAEEVKQVSWSVRFDVEKDGRLSPCNGMSGEKTGESKEFLVELFSIFRLFSVWIIRSSWLSTISFSPLEVSFDSIWDFSFSASFRGFSLSSRVLFLFFLESEFRIDDLN